MRGRFFTRSTSIIFCIFSCAAFAEEVSLKKENCQEACSVGIVDMDAVNEKATEMLAIRNEANRLREVYQKEIASLEKSLRDERARLDGDKGNLPLEEKESRERAFEIKENQLRQLVRRRKYQWEQALDGAKERFLQKFQGVIARIAQERHLSVVLVKSAAPYHTESCDVTQRTVELLNAEVASITFSSPQEGKK